MAQEKDHGPRIGADPELFVQTADGVVIPVCGRIGGTKTNPLIINELIEAHYGKERSSRPRRRLDVEDNVERQGDYAVQEDNVMLEFNIPAYKDTSYFVEAVAKMIAVLETDFLLNRGIAPKYEVTHTFKTTELAPFPQAFTVGCLPDMNAYAEDNRFERRPFSAEQFGNNRFCGGHLHVQYNHGNVPRHVFAQFMDLVVELPYLRWDKQKMRRLFYGQPGIYREKPYGIEYRTPSNFWLSKQFRDKHLASMVENINSLALTANTKPELLKERYLKIDWYSVQEAIQNEDAKQAEEIVEYARNKLGMYMSTVATR